MIGKIAAIVCEPRDDVGEIVVEFAAGIEIRYNFFVFEICIFETLKNLFSLFGGGVTTASCYERGVCFFDAGYEL